MMNDNIEGHDREVTLPPEQLSDWYKKLKKMENSLILIMMKRRQFKKNYFHSEKHDSPRGTIAMVSSGLVMLASWTFKNNLGISPFITPILGIVVYFLTLKFSNAPSDDKERILHILNDLKFPAESELVTLFYPPDATPEMIADKMFEIIKREQALIQRTPGFQLSPSK
ncbi:hypothetical protein [Klebsiella sp. CN_Kp100]|uniref:hypothetical protein n=1 Tax=Klebsiella sp. CN_Kp100 TaxID=3153422 RepID=UPI0032B5ED1A|nr:hypothetical protein [Klebsiella oxytoca]